ncbi:S8 family serine peptidase [Chitinivibrio alkaliphilus]|nr:S8 family serine peptidase [Chitinivibrio alkaliphilus]
MKYLHMRAWFHALSRRSFVFIALLAFSIFVQLQGAPRRTAEVPPVVLSEVSDSAYYPGRIRIKVREEAQKLLQKEPLRTVDHGAVQTGIADLDVLNESFAVSRYKQTFSGLAEAAALRSPAVRARHELWGFYRWYDLTLSDSASVISAVESFAQHPDVLIAEPVYRIVRYGDESRTWRPNDPEFTNQWHYHNTGQNFGTVGSDISLKEAWTIERGHADVLVAIIDDGVDHSHPDLQGNMWDGIGKNFADDHTDDIIPGNHGTHVAGTVAAMNNNGIGVAGIAGGDETERGVTLMGLQILGGEEEAFGGGGVAPVFAADNGSAISQNSWGYDAPDVYNQADLDAIDYFNEHGGGAVMNGGISIFAAGNDGEKAEYYPAAYEATLSVAATNNKDERASYSNYGETVDISAPGGGFGHRVISTVAGGGYGGMQGTSMACPHVSGVAALVLSAAHRNGVTLDSEELRTILLETTDPIDDENPDFIGMLGTGRLNAAAALHRLQDEYLPDLIAPAFFTASSPNVERVELAWEKNSAQHDVLILRSEDAVFGTPEDAYSYAPGDSLAGGGVVVYTGGGTEVVDEGLQKGTTYYYRAFSVDSEGGYSQAWQNASATTWHFTEAGTADDPRIIDSEDKLKALSSFSRYWDGHYRQKGDLDVAGTTKWNDGAGFMPIGSEETPFTGAYHGGGHRLVNLTIDAGQDYVGFFGFIKDGYVDSLGIVDADISGGSQTGALVGSLRGGEIYSSFTTGNVSGAILTGGFVGGAHDGSRIENSYAKTSVTGSQYVGGFIGSAQKVELENVFSTQSVDADFGAGGFAGTAGNEAIATAAYWDMESSAVATSNLGEGKTTAQMTDSETFDEWDTTQWMLPGETHEGYPFLLWEDKNTILFTEIEEKVFGDLPFMLSVSASSGLPVSLSLSRDDVISLDGTEVTILNAGEVDIIATQEGDDLYDPAEEVRQTFTVLPAPVKIEIRHTQQTYDGTPRSVSVYTEPEDISHSIRYDGEENAPFEKGTYEVVVEVTEKNYIGVDTAELRIEAETEIIHVDTIGDTPGRAGLFPVKNPASLADEQFKFALTAPEAVTASIRIFDALGNLIDTQEDPSPQGSGHLFSWDMTNRRGQQVGPGTYVIIATVETETGQVQQFREVIGLRK